MLSLPPFPPFLPFALHSLSVSSFSILTYPPVEKMVRGSPLTESPGNLDSDIARAHSRQ